MSVILTEEQVRAIGEHPDEPLRLIDPLSNRSYVLLDEERYAELESLFERDSHISDAYPAMDRAFAEGWNFPRMEDYDRYEELKLR